MAIDGPYPIAYPHTNVIKVQATYLRYAHLRVHVTYRDLPNLLSQNAGMFVCLCDYI